MKTIESTLSQLTDLSIVEDLRKVLREKDQEFLPVEAKFQEAVSDLVTRIGKHATQELMAAWDQQICSDLVYAGYLGFQANLHNFHNPVANQFLPWVEPGYVSDGAQTSMYALELHRDLGFRVS